MPGSNVYQLILALGTFLGCYVALWQAYRTLYKRNWASDTIRGILNRTRFFAYLLAFTASLRVGLGQYGVSVGPNLLTSITNLDIVLVLLLLVEVALGISFDLALMGQARTALPAIFRHLARITLYGAVVVGCSKALFGWDVTPLLTGSAILSVVIGLALQESLGNLFSGLFLHGSQPFGPGQWIAVGDRQGRVESVDWRSTALRTLTGDIVIIPNSHLAKEIITNYSSPSPLHARTVRTTVALRHPPARVRALLIECALRSHGVSQERAPSARLLAFNESGAVFETKFWITDFEAHVDIESEVLQKIWYCFHREKVEIAYPHQVQYHPISPLHDSDLRRHLSLLRNIDFLSDFTPGELETLAEQLSVLMYSPGETIIHQGEPGTSFYVLRDGKAQVRMADSEGHVFFVKDLTRGQFFGEISLLTGEPRTATVVAVEETSLLRVDKEAFRAVMETHPRADELICKAIERRAEFTAAQESALSRRLQSDTQSSESPRVSKDLLQRIRDFFAY